MEQTHKLFDFNTNGDFKALGARITGTVVFDNINLFLDDGTNCSMAVLTKARAIQLIVGIRSLLRQHPYVCDNFDIGLTEDMIPTLSEKDLVEFRIKVLKSLLSIKSQKVRAELRRNTVWMSKLELAAINNQVLLARLEQRLNISCDE